MSDIVEALRRSEGIVTEQEAADEIERLRSERDQIRQMALDHENTMFVLAGRIAKLNAVAEAALADVAMDERVLEKNPPTDEECAKARFALVDALRELEVKEDL